MVDDFGGTDSENGYYGPVGPEVGSPGPNPNQGPPGPPGPSTDRWAATRIVSLDPDQGTDLTIQGAIDNLPAEGGSIFVKQGPYSIAASIVFPDKDVTIVFAAGASLNWGANPGACIVVPDGLTKKRSYILQGLPLTGAAVSGQIAIQLNDSHAFGYVSVFDYNITGFPIIVDIANGDASYVLPVVVHFERGNAVPTALNDPMVTTVNPANSYVLPAQIELVDSYWLNIKDFTVGWLFNIDCDIVLESSKLVIGFIASPGEVRCQCDGFSADGSSQLIGQGAIQPLVPGPGFTFKSALRYSGPMFWYNIEVIGMEMDGVQLYIQSDHATIDGLLCFADATITFANSNIKVVNSKWEQDPIITNRACIEMVDGAVNCLVQGCRFQASGGFALIHNFSQGLRIVACHFEASAGTYTIFDDTTATTTTVDACSGTTSGLGISLVASSIFEGALRADATAVATTDAYVAVFTHTNPKGLLGIGTIKNTGGVNSLKVRETVTDAFGVTDATTETVVTAGNDYMLNPQTNFGASRPPYVSYKVEVKANSAGNQTTYSLRHVSQGSEV